MGDMADDLTERGVGEWFAHLDGDCAYGCPYCAQEEKAKRRRPVSPPQEPSQPARAPRLVNLCEEINRRFPEFRAEMEHWSASFDRHPKGVRWRIPGKHREGKVLRVYWRDEPWGRPILSHNPQEAYRCNDDVVRWIAYDAPKIIAARAPHGGTTPTPDQETT